MKFSADNLKGVFSKDKIGDWIVKYKRQVAVGCVAFCLVVFAGVSLAGSGASAGDGGAAPASSDVSDGAQSAGEEQQGAVVSGAAAAEAAATENVNPLEQDAYPEVNELIQNYYNYMAAGDMEGLASVEDTTSEEEQNRILRSRDLVEGYQNISCYTKKGLEDGSYLVFVYYELKFAQIDTAAPGLSALYVYTNDEGNLVIFNGEASDELNAYVEEMAQEEDVLALREEVRVKYEEAKAADANLAEQEERYLRIAESSSETTEEQPAEEQPAEEQPAEEQPAEEQPAEEQPAEEQPAEEQPAEEQPAEEQPAEENTATAQNRETRFTESVRLRSEPNTESEYLGTAYQGEHVTQIESYDSGWSKINYNGTECYCMTQYLE